MNLFLTTSLFLFGLPLIAVPLVLHFLHRHPKTVTYFPALEFLLRAQTRIRNSNSLWKLLILALRILAILLLCLAFCRPYLSSVLPQPREGTLLLWDDSASLHGAAREELLAQLEYRLDQVTPATPASLGLWRDHGVIWSGPFTGNPAELREFLHLRSRQSSTGNFASLPIQCDFRFAAFPADAHRVFLFTDHQRLPWERCRNNLDFEYVTGFEVIRPIRTAIATANRRIDHTSSHFDGAALVVTVEVVNDSDQLFQGSLHLNPFGAAPLFEAVAIAPRGRSVVTLRTNSLPSIPAGKVTLQPAEDALPADNTRFFTIDRPGELTRVGSAPDGNVNFTALALEQNTAGQLPTQPGGFVVEPAPGSRSTEQLAELKEFLEQGGTAAILLDDSARTANFLASFGVRLNPSHAKERGRHRLGAIATTHPVWQRLLQAGVGGWHDVLFTEWIRVELPEEAIRIAEFDHGAPAIAELPAGRGRLWLLMTPVGEGKTNWTGHGSFLPFWKELERYAVRRESASATVNQTLPVPENTVLEWTTDGEFVPATTTDRPGIYRAGSRYFSVNPAVEESKLEPVEADFSSNWHTVEQVPSPAPDTATADGSRNELFAWFLAAALLALLLETALANRTAL